MSRSLRRLRVGIACLAFLAGVPLFADDGLQAFSLDLPYQGSVALPAWLSQPQVPETTFATLNLPIQPPDTTSSLLVTLFFQEKTDGFLRVIWKNASASQELSSNFYEGIGMSNQRSLLISPDTLQGGGTLILQCGDMALGVQRIRFQWLKSQAGLVSPEILDTLVTPAPGSTQTAQALDGQPPAAGAAAWQQQVVTVPVTDTPQRIEQGVEFSVQVDNAPASGRIKLKENGLPWGKHLVVWINQQRAGTMTPAVPDLTDDGFLPAASSVYVGLREGSFFIPGSALKAGTDTLQFSVEDDGQTDATAPDPAAAPLPLAVKEVVLQLNCPVTAPAAAAAPPATVAPPPPVTPPASDPLPNLTPTSAPVLISPPADPAPAVTPNSSATPTGPTTDTP
jgi:hypothetical protein